MILFHLSWSVVLLDVLHIFTTLSCCSYNFSLLRLDVILYSLAVFCCISRNERFLQGHYMRHVRKLHFLSFWDDNVSLILPLLMVEKFLLMFLNNMEFNNTWPNILIQTSKRMSAVCTVWVFVGSGQDYPFLLWELIFCLKLHSLRRESAFTGDQYIWGLY